MKGTFGLFVSGLAMLCLVVGCGRFSGTDNLNTGSANSGNSGTQAPAVKAVDVPALIGKSIEDVKKSLGPPKSELAGRLRWEYPQGELAVEPLYEDKKKVGYFEFTAAMVSVGGQVAQGFASYDKLGDMIGIDTRGLTPADIDEGETGSVTFEKVNLNGKNVDEVTFSKVSGSFKSVTVRPVRGY